MFGTLQARFRAKVDTKNGPRMPHMRSRCHVFTSAKGNTYGQIYVAELGRPVAAHRVAWFLATGDWPDPLALHECDWKPCVRLTHLREGTHIENMEDVRKRGRSKNRRPISTVCKKLHELTEANTYYFRGRRHCATCGARP